MEPAVRRHRRIVRDDGRDEAENRDAEADRGVGVVLESHRVSSKEDPREREQALKVRRIRAVAAHEQYAGAETPLHLVYRAVDEPPLDLRLVRRVEYDVVSLPRVLLLQAVLPSVVGFLRRDVRVLLVVGARIEQTPDDGRLDRWDVQAEDAASRVDDPVGREAVLRGSVVSRGGGGGGGGGGVSRHGWAFAPSEQYRSIVVALVAVRVVAVRPRRRVPVQQLGLLRLLQRLAHVLEVHPDPPGGGPVTLPSASRRGGEQLSRPRLAQLGVARVPRELVRPAPHETPVAVASDQRPGLRRGRAPVAPELRRALRVAELPNPAGPPHPRGFICVRLVLLRSPEERPHEGTGGVSLGRGHLPPRQLRLPVLVVTQDAVVDDDGW